MDTRPPLEAALGAFGLPAVVTPPDTAPVETTAFWLPPTAEAVPGDSRLQRRERYRLLVLSRADVPECPRGTVVEVAEWETGEVLAWKVDAFEDADVDHHRVLVLPVPES